MYLTTWNKGTWIRWWKGGPVCSHPSCKQYCMLTPTHQSSLIIHLPNHLWVRSKIHYTTHTWIQNKQTHNHTYSHTITYSMHQQIHMRSHTITYTYIPSVRSERASVWRERTQRSLWRCHRRSDATIVMVLIVIDDGDDDLNDNVMVIVDLVEQNWYRYDQCGLSDSDALDDEFPGRDYCSGWSIGILQVELA